MKKKILMLEGPIQTGKSTLIRTMLGDHLPKCGGFTSQRLIDASGRTKGFRLCPAAADLTGPDEGITEDVFKYFRPDGSVCKDQSVFERTGTALLRESAGRPLILLDEIGGSELLCDAFCAALYEVLTGDAPCLGVLKLADNARRLDRSYEGAPIGEANERLRRMITDEPGGTVLRFDRCGAPETVPAAEHALAEFIGDVFHTQGNTADPEDQHR